MAEPAHFCAEAARAMRRILVDYAVRRGAKKRGGDRVRVEVDDSLAMTEAEAGALDRLADEVAPRIADDVRGNESQMTCAGKQWFQPA